MGNWWELSPFLGGDFVWSLLFWGFVFRGSGTKKLILLYEVLIWIIYRVPSWRIIGLPKWIISGVSKWSLNWTINPYFPNSIPHSHLVYIAELWLLAIYKIITVYFEKFGKHSNNPRRLGNFWEDIAGNWNFSTDEIFFVNRKRCYFNGFSCTMQQLEIKSNW